MALQMIPGAVSLAEDLHRVAEEKIRAFEGDYSVDDW